MIKTELWEHIVSPDQTPILFEPFKAWGRPCSWRISAAPPFNAGRRTQTSYVIVWNMQEAAWHFLAAASVLVIAFTGIYESNKILSKG